MHRFTILIAFVLFINFSNAQHLFVNDNMQCKNHLIENKLSLNVFNEYSWYSNYNVTYYKLDITAERDTTYISGNVIINAITKSIQMDTFFFEISPPLQVDAVKINGIININHHQQNDIHFAVLPTTINPETPITVQIFYHGTPVSTGFFSGISSAISSSWGNQVTWTLSEPFSAKVWWPCKQDLKDKADSADIFITTNFDNKAGSNGILTSVVPLLNNKVRYEWKTRYAIDYYLIFFSIAKYIDYSIYAKPTGLQDSILIQNYIYDNPSCLLYYKNEIDRTVDFIELFSDLLGMYPFKNEKYGHCIAELGGGMEHQTMTTLGFFSFDLVSHELTHMWFGDNVTCATWNDIWINEGWATYGQYIAKQYLINQAAADTFMMSVHQIVRSLPDGSVFIPLYQTLDEARIFDGRLSYNKGAAIIHMIRYELNNDSIFFNVIKDFQNIFKDSTASGMDFKNILELNSGKNFTDFFDQWYFGEGYPVYDILWGQQNDTLRITSHQYTSTSTTNLFKMPIEYRINFAGGDTMIRLNQTSNVDNFNIFFDKNILSIEVDPCRWTLAIINSIVQEIEEKQADLPFTLFPNPVSDQLNIIIPNPGQYSIKISDITGKTTHVSIMQNAHFFLKLSDFPVGIYILSISDGINTSYKRFIKY